MAAGNDTCQDLNGDTQHGDPTNLPTTHIYQHLRLATVPWNITNS